MPRPDQCQRDRIGSAIAALPPQTRLVYRLHLLDGLDYPAIASRLAIDTGEVERCIAEAIVLIDRELRRHESGLPRTVPDA